MYPEEWDTEIADRKDRDSQLLVMAREWYGVKLMPVRVKKFGREGESERGGKAHSKAMITLRTVCTDIVPYTR